MVVMLLCTEVSHSPRSMLAHRQRRQCAEEEARGWQASELLQFRVSIMFAEHNGRGEVSKQQNSWLVHTFRVYIRRCLALQNKIGNNMEFGPEDFFSHLFSEV